MFCVLSKRRRTQAELEEIKRQQEEPFEVIHQKEERIEELERELDESNRRHDDTVRYENLVNEMLEAGALVREPDGTFRIPGR